MSKIYEWQEKKKKALIAICTLGLSEAPWSFLFSSASQADNGLSFAGTIFGYILRVLWFIFWTALSCVVLWIINIFKYINYSLSIRKYRKSCS